MVKPARVAQTHCLNAPVTTLRFIDSKRAGQLEKLGIRTVRDLIEHYPRRYLDLTKVSKVGRIQPGESVTCVCTVGEVRTKRPRHTVIVEAFFHDDTGCMVASWFAQPWIARQLLAGERVVLSGKAVFSYGYFRMQNPIFEILGKVEGDEAGQGDGISGFIVPVHPLTESISGNWMRRFVKTALEASPCPLDPLPASLKVRRGLMSRQAAWRAIHFPHDMQQARLARERLAFEELLVLQLFMRRRRLEEDAQCSPFAHITTGRFVQDLSAALPFELTDDQARARSEILADMARPERMRRMLLGDVGTGKTAVAAFALAAAADSCTQAAMMAPTSVLARQYAEKLGHVLDKAGISWVLLTGASSAAERREALAGLESGQISVAFGTHALIEPDVRFMRLTLVVIDEQHRFGVAQREALQGKGPGCDMLLMTATPIPRTLALMFFGDTDCSYLRTRPAARQPTQTVMLSRRDISKAYDEIRSCVSRGEQAYIICPLIGVKDKDKQGQVDASSDGLSRDMSDAAAAEREAAFLSSKVFPDLKVELLTGRMRSADKLRVMGDFCDGRIDVLVSTTVVEVGVDVPGATVMVIHDADFFGLSQLHQLRGRVGRGKRRGKVFLVTGKLEDQPKQRLKALCKTDDGFELAASDLEMRREGDMLGRRQSGRTACKLVDVVKDAEMIPVAFEEACAILDEDPGLALPKHRLLACEVSRMGK